MEYENKSYKGQAIGGLTLGIIGTALALTNGNWGGGCGNGNGSILGGLFGGNRCCGNRQEEIIAAQGSEIAQLRSEKYTDYVGHSLYKNIVDYSNREDAKISQLQAEVTAYVIDLDKRTALNEQAQRLNREYDNLARDAGFKLLEQKMDCCCERLNSRIDCLSDKTGMADASIVSFITSNYIPGTLKLPITSICPEPATATA